MNQEPAETFIVVDHRADGRTQWVAAPPGHYRAKDGAIVRDKSTPLTSGPEMTDRRSHAYRFGTHCAAARVANRCGATAKIQPAPPEQPLLTDEQIDILKHTAKNGRYCGGGADTERLAALGFLLYLGKVAWCPDPYYSITGHGQEAIRQHHYQPQSGKPQQHKPTEIPAPPWK